jgi:hypothetical protein
MADLTQDDPFAAELAKRGLAPSWKIPDTVQQPGADQTGFGSATDPGMLPIGSEPMQPPAQTQAEVQPASPQPVEPQAQAPATVAQPTAQAHKSEAGLGPLTHEADPFTGELARRIYANPDTRPLYALPGGIGKLPDFLHPVDNFIRAFNDRLAENAAIPVHALRVALAQVGVKLMNKEITTTDAVKQVFGQLGLGTGAADHFSATVGKSTFDGLVSAAALLYAAPVLGATEGATALSRVFKELGDWAVKQPWLAASMELTSSIGAKEGEKAIGPYGAVPGAMIGGFAPAIVKPGARLIYEAGRGLGRPLGKLAGKLLDSIFPGPKGLASTEQSVVAPGVGAEYAHTYAKSQIEGDIAQADQAIKDAIDGVPAHGNPRIAEARARARLETSLKAARKQEDAMWARVPKGEAIDGQPLVQTAENMLASADELGPTDLPGEFISSILKDKALSNGQPIKVSRLLNLRKKLLHAISAERALPASNRTKIGYMVDLEEATLDTIAKALPDDVSIQQARDFSRTLNDMYTRGPVGQVLRYRVTREPAVPPGQTVRYLLDQYEGFSQINKIGEAQAQAAAAAAPQGPSRPGIPGAGMTAPGAARGNVPTATEDAVRALFKEAIDEGGPEGAAKFLKRHRENLDTLVRVGAQVKDTVDTITTQTAKKAAIQKSFASRFIQADPDKAVASIFSARDPEAAAREVLKQVRGHPDALAGYRNAVMDYMLRRAVMAGKVTPEGTVRFSPTRVLDMLVLPQNKRVLQAVLDETQYRRFTRIVNEAAQIEQGNEHMLKRMTREGATIFARIIGAQTGRAISHLTGGGTVQTPGIVSTVFRRIAEDTFAGIPPDEFLIRAINDPAWERLLHQRVPSDTREARNFLLKARTIISYTQGAMELGRGVNDQIRERQRGGEQR